MRLLLIEDDRVMAESLRQGLKQEGYVIDIAHNGVDGEYLGETEPYDLIILDLGLPQRSGMEVLHNWRANNLQMPVLILTARDAWYEKVDGLKAGADDYLTKPFHFEELAARVRALLRRSVGQAQSQLSVGGIVLDDDEQTATTATGPATTLTGTEYRLLRYLMMHPHRIHSRTSLYEHLYEYDDDRDSNVIEVYIRRLRDKFGRQLIETRRGQGYRYRGVGECSP